MQESSGKKDSSIERPAARKQSGISNALKWNLPVRAAAINFPAACCHCCCFAGRAQPVLSVFWLCNGEPIRAQLHQEVLPTSPPCCYIQHGLRAFWSFFQKSEQGKKTFSIVLPCSHHPPSPELLFILLC